MSRRVPLRDDLSALGAYHSPQVPAEVRLNTNESPFPPPAAWSEALAEALRATEFHRYPDRHAIDLREGIATLHGVGRDEVFCANGSNEVLQCLLLAYGGEGRRALVFEPTYALHAHIARLTGTGLCSGKRDADLRVDPEEGARVIGEHEPDLVFLCSPNNPTGRLEDPGVVERLAAAAPGLVVVDEAYGQFAPWSALSLRADPGTAEGLVVVRTFSKTWAMAGARLGYLVADPDIVDGCAAAALPYHLSVQTQLAGLLALRFADDMAERVRRVEEERGRLTAGLDRLGVEVWPSDANFILFRPRTGRGHDVWTALLEGGILVRDFSTRHGLEGCLRVTVGTTGENERFLTTLERILA